MGWDELMAAARRGEGPLRHARAIRQRLLEFHLPIPRPLAGLLYAERNLRSTLWPVVAQMFYREPLLRHRARVGRRPRLDGALPEIMGSGRITLGDDVVIGDRNSWIVGFKCSTQPELIIGDRVHLNYQVLLSVATTLTIGADTLLAGNVQVYDNISHPLEPDRRRRHEGFRLDEASPVTIGSNVWIGNRAMILRGVTIGDDSVVAAGAIVTKPVPPATLVGGNPARVIRELAPPPAV